MDDSSYDNVTQDLPEGIPRDVSAPAEHPQRIGRYRIENLLGQGGFGLVYLARDEQLDRLVAIKVPHAKLVPQPRDAEAYLAEARTVANLDHTHIVPVFDVGSTVDCPCYVVSKYVEGTDLSAKLKQHRLKFRDAAELVATVAEALHYAHKQGLVHRDVKPGNILIDGDGRPFVVDFGLALREENIGKGPKYAGTPAYTSPEQARGEGHRVDGRSDIFSLGVVLYELLAGRQPFRGDTRAEIFEQVTSYEPRPLRQYDEKLPKELERICYKAMAKRASDRYSSAHDMAEDLRQFLAEQSMIHAGVSPRTFGSVAHETMMTQGGSTAVASGGDSLSAGSGPTSDSQPIKIVPKGLRSFDAHDADFFLELLPGPRGRDGLPDSLRFWKTRIEETDPDNTFSVGLIYGPSGCGKSSLVKAGLLPRLSEDVLIVYIEATPEETESRLLRELRKRFPALEGNLSLKDTLVALRRGQAMPVGRKVLIVLDQFEQWLHAKTDENPDLVQALRQCDCARVQCIVMVRDEFWMAVSRFLRKLEVRLIEGYNIAPVDLFDLDHARKVLAAFGRAFGKLAEVTQGTSNEQKEFIKQSVAGLAEEGKVTCVRLALFAEMMKGKLWTASTLNEVGGTTGVGVSFLDETFNSSSASPEHRYHQKAARAVLKALLPEAGTDIKGEMKSYYELLDASGYSNRPTEFEDVIRILDSEIRLITPTDTDGVEVEDAVSHDEPSQKYYQLTHDYLVHSLREWLTRKQKETRRGRAELRLSERSALWISKSENRYLPNIWEYANIRALIRRSDWTVPERRMMKKARRLHEIRLFMVAAAVGLLCVTSWVAINRRQNQIAESVVDRLISAKVTQLPDIIPDVKKHSARIIDHLVASFEDESEEEVKLNIALAMLSIAEETSRYESWAIKQIPDAAPERVIAIGRSLAALSSSRSDIWNEIIRLPEDESASILRFACTLSLIDPEFAKIQAHNMTPALSQTISDELASSRFARQWMPLLLPLKDSLNVPLNEILADLDRDDGERLTAGDALSLYLPDDQGARIRQLAQLLVLAVNNLQFEVFLGQMRDEGQDGVTYLEKQLEYLQEKRHLAVEIKEREEYANHQLRLALALLRLESPRVVWPIFGHFNDPTLRSLLIDAVARFRVDPTQIWNRLQEETDVCVRKALLLCLGEYVPAQLRSLPPDTRSVLDHWWRAVDDPGLHAAVDWLIRRWRASGFIDDEQKELPTTREADLAEVVGQGRRWYLNEMRHTMAVLDGSVTFTMGSPDTEFGREGSTTGAFERRHQRRISRRFAIDMREVTVDQFAVAWKTMAERYPELEGSRSVATASFDYNRQYSSTADCPVNRISWYHATAYCNWLSDRVGIPRSQWCYVEISEEGISESKFADGMRLRDDYLDCIGYRLPTEAEWEFACRAGADTSRFYGDSVSLLPRYAWYQANSEYQGAVPVGTLKPNDFGLFDVLGNVAEWCHDRPFPYPTGGNPFVDLQRVTLIRDAELMIFRGGAFEYVAPMLRSAGRERSDPYWRNYQMGFRVARTMPVGP